MFSPILRFASRPYDHKVLWNKSVPLDPDLNKYDLEHALTPHPDMSKAEWEKLYRDAWAIYYTSEHIETILRRAQANGINILQSPFPAPLEPSWASVDRPRY